MDSGDEETNTPDVSTTPRTSYRITHTASAKRKRDDEQVDMMASIARVLNNRDDEDDCAMFGGYVIETLRKLSFRVRSDAISEMAGTMHRATLRDYPETTHGYNPSTGSMTPYQQSTGHIVQQEITRITPMQGFGASTSSCTSSSTQQLVDHTHQLIDRDLNRTPPPSRRPDFQHLYSM